MSKELSALEAFQLFCRELKIENSEFANTIENALKKQADDELELEVFKLAYEWKCNGVEGTYEEVLELAKRSVEGWKEIERNGYGTIIAE